LSEVKVAFARILIIELTRVKAVITGGQSIFGLFDVSGHRDFEKKAIASQKKPIVQMSVQHNRAPDEKGNLHCKSARVSHTHNQTVCRFSDDLYSIW